MKSGREQFHGRLVQLLSNIVKGSAVLRTLALTSMLSPHGCILPSTAPAITAPQTLIQGQEKGCFSPHPPTSLKKNPIGFPE